MSTNHSTTPVRAVVYYRMSDDKQENSIDRQRSQVEPYTVQENLEIVRVYQDEGIPGDEVEKRPDFRRMLKDAERGLFDAIVCDDKDRFGRLDSIEYGFYVKPLRDRGIKLMTVAQGLIDWCSMAGRMQDAMTNEFKAAEGRATSRRVLTRMMQMARDGKYLGGPPPYGYVLTYRQVERPGKAPKMVADKLVPDPDKAKVVRLIFDLYGNRGYSLDDIAAELHARAVARPGKSRTNGAATSWRISTIVGILRNRKYLGDLPWNVMSEGKYHAATGNGKVVEHALKNSKARPRDEEDWIVAPESHEPIIDRDLFERVQLRLERNQKATTPVPGGGDFLLRSLIVCGHCGARMIGRKERGGRKVYSCGRYRAEGRHACHHNWMAESKLIDVIVRKIQEEYLNPARLEEVRREISRQDAAAAQTLTQDAGDLRKRIAEVEANIARATRNLALAETPQDMADISALLREWRPERDRLAGELDRRTGGADRAEAERELAEAEKHLWRLREALLSDEPREVRSALQELIVRVELVFTHRKTAKQTRCEFSRGLIVVRTQESEDACLSTAAVRRRGRSG
jgi:DNA invertase Pin-like site-specific DNA recombinase